MRKLKANLTLFLFLSLLFSCKQKEKTFIDLINDQLDFAARQYIAMSDATKDSSSLPRSADKSGKLLMAPSDWWTSGFVPGTLWYLYDNSMDTVFRNAAVVFTRKVEKEQYNTGTHDLGFMLYCSYGNAYRLTADTSYKRVLLTGAKSLITRFHPKVGLIQSWGSNEKWQYPVIIDNMMNLEFLMWAFKATGDSTYYKICVSHADSTMKNHYRPDYSCYHVVNYDTITGKVISKQTAQGAADESAWARGQSWGLYGYTMMYRETKLPRYLEQAINIANFLIKHPNLPEDKVPYWDYNAPKIPNEPRDASSAAIMCSALTELCQYVDPTLYNEYLQVAKEQIKSLSSPRYRAEAGKNGNFILMHSVGSIPHNSEIDVPLTYADYYYVEALIRMKTLLEKGKQ